MAVTADASSTAEAPARVSNNEFARRVGCHYTMASRLRSGQRLPSAALLTRISREFGIPSEDLLKAREQGTKAFSALLCRYVPLMAA